MGIMLHASAFKDEYMNIYIYIFKKFELDFGPQWVKLNRD